MGCGFFHAGVLTMAVKLKPAEKLPKDAAFGGGHLFPEP
jgi:hypothetical protein